MIDKYSNLKKCKTRLVVYKNQQTKYNLFTIVMILVITFLQILLTINAKFILEIL